MLLSRALARHGAALVSLRLSRPQLTSPTLRGVSGAPRALSSLNKPPGRAAGYTADGPVHKRVPEGDSVERMVCDDCGFINYRNPVPVVGVVPWHDGKVLLCKRAIEPCRGLWTIPAGYMEAFEDAAVGAAREAHEEACAQVTVGSLLCVFSIPRISQVQIFFRGTMDEPVFSPGPESLEVGLFAPEEIPWGEIAFPSITKALRYCLENPDSESVRYETIDAKLRSSPT